MDGRPANEKQEPTAPPRYFIFFPFKKPFVCSTSLAMEWPTVNSPPKKFSQIQLLSIGRANNKKLNQVKKKKKRKRQFLGQLRDLLPAVMTYNNNNNKSSQKGKSTEQ